MPAYASILARSLKLLFIVSPSAVMEEQPFGDPEHLSISCGGYWFSTPFLVCLLSSVLVTHDRHSDFS